MQVLCAPDSFKGTLRAVDAAAAMAAGLAGPGVEVDLCPIADGGEGTLDAFCSGFGARCKLRQQAVTGPLGQPVMASWAMLESPGKDLPIGIIEMAQASGLMLVPPDKRDPTRTTSYGTGELIRAAITTGCGEIIVGIGGSATCDGGCGAAQALGVSFFRKEGARIERPVCGHDLGGLLKVVAPPTPGSLHFSQSRRVKIRVMCDVTNPLCGPTGAAAIYGPQKGATPKQVQELDAGLSRLATLCPHVDPDTPGMGAAGGLGFGLVGFLDATLESGIDCILEAAGFAERLTSADVVLTGEGSFDRQSLSGKAVSGVALAALGVDVPVVVIAGTATDELTSGELAELGIQRVISLSSEFGEDRALSDPAACIRQITERLRVGWMG